MNKERHTGGNK